MPALAFKTPPQSRQDKINPDHAQSCWLYNRTQNKRPAKPVLLYVPFPRAILSCILLRTREAVRH